MFSTCWNSLTAVVDPQTLDKTSADAVIAAKICPSANVCVCIYANIITAHGNLGLHCRQTALPSPGYGINFTMVMLSPWLLLPNVAVALLSLHGYPETLKNV